MESKEVKKEKVVTTEEVAVNKYKTRAEIEALLSEPLPADALKSRTQGSKEFTYLEGWWVKQNLNRIFGVGRWSYKGIFEHMKKVEMEPIADKYNQGQFKEHGAYSCPVEVTIQIEDDTLVLSDVGITEYNGANQKETAMKGCITDGLKRAVACLGTQFGLDLYDTSTDDDSVAPMAGQATQVVTRTAPTSGNIGKSPMCDLCNRPMSLKQRKDGSGSFWGCTGYPNCKNIYNAEDVTPDGIHITKSKNSAGPSADSVKNGTYMSSEEMLANLTSEVGF